MRLQTILLVALALVCLAAGSASAQVMSWQMQVFQVGVNTTTGSPFFTLDLPPSTVTCNTTIVMPTLQTSPANPRTLYWTHDSLAGQVCMADLSGQSGFISLPAGGPYPFVLVAVNEAGTSPRGVGENPFRVVSLPTAPATVRIKR
jgi:hypothetical protein